MSAAISPDVIGPSVTRPFPADVRLTTNFSHSFSRQLETLREMLWAMDALTIEGQRHSMQKILEFIANQVSRLGPSTSWRNHETLARLVQKLAIESERRSPDVNTFTAGAENLISLLKAIT